MSGDIRDRSDRYRGTELTQATKHHGAELELDPLRHAEPMKFVAENVSQSAVVRRLRATKNFRGQWLLVTVLSSLLMYSTVTISITDLQRHYYKNRGTKNAAFVPPIVTFLSLIHI